MISFQCSICEMEMPSLSHNCFCSVLWETLGEYVKPGISDARYSLREEHRQAVKFMGKRFSPKLKYLFDELYSNIIVLEKLDETLEEMKKMKLKVMKIYFCVCAFCIFPL